MTVTDAIRALAKCPLDAQVVIGQPMADSPVRRRSVGGLTYNIGDVEIIITDEPDKPRTETVVLWPRTEGT